MSGIKINLNIHIRGNCIFLIGGKGDFDSSNTRLEPKSRRIGKWEIFQKANV